MTICNTQAIRKAIAAMFPDRYSRQNWRTLLFDFVNDSLKPIIIRWFNNWEDSINGKEERPSLDFPPELTPAAELLAKQEGLTYAQLAIYHYIQFNQLGAVQAKYIQLTELHKTSHSHNSFKHLEKPVDLSGDGLSLAMLKYYTGTDRLDESNLDALAVHARTEYDKYKQLLADHICSKKSQLGEGYTPREDVGLPTPPLGLFSAVTLLAAFRGLTYQNLAWDVYMVRLENEAAHNALESAYANNARLIQQLDASTGLIKGINDPESRAN